MANIILTPTIISKELLFQLKNNLVLGNNVHRAFEKEFKKIGNTITFRKPVRFSSSSGMDITAKVQDVTELSDTVIINQHSVVPWAFSEEDLTLTIEQMSERYLKPAAMKIADDIDRSIAKRYVDVFYTEGVAGTTPNAFSNLANLGKKMDKMAIPPEDRLLVVDPDANWSMADALKGTFEDKGASDFLRRGFLGHIAGFDILKTQCIYNHTKGTATSVVVHASTYTTGTTAITSTLYTKTGTGTLVAGDVINIAGVYAVNPISKQATTDLMQFTVVTGLTLAGTKDSVTISPAIRTSGPYQNVSAAPANNAAVTLTGNHAANLAFYKNAFALVMAPIDMEEGLGLKSQSISEDGYALTLTMFADGMTMKKVFRVDARWAVKTIYPEVAMRLLG